jgi:hypothetical protein
MAYSSSLNIHFNNTNKSTSDFDLKSTCELINSEQERKSILPNHSANKPTYIRKLNYLLAKRACALTTVISLALIILTVLLLVSKSYQTHHQDTKIVSKTETTPPRSIPAKVCTSVECYSASNFLIKHLNQSEQPCHDFYEFACGEWTRSGENKLETDQFTMAIDNFLVDLSSLLDEPYMPVVDSKVVQNLKKFYESCTNELDIEANSDVQFYEYLRSEFGDWPMVPLDADVIGRKLTNKLGRSGIFDKEGYIEVVLARLTILHMPLVFRFANDLSPDHRLLMRLSTPQDFCVLQNFLPGDRKEREAFDALVKEVVDSMQGKLSWEGGNI